MSNYAIKVEGLGKRYRIGERQRYKALRDVLTGALYAPARAAGRLLRREGRGAREESHIWALKDVSFEVQHGEVLGIIGRNGAGKSTLLKILSRITEPTEGVVRLHGRVGSLLEVGTGFHPELTGRDNVYLNGAILGMHRHEIERKFDEIVTFAEIEQFLDTPVKHYSSGMYVRLAFAVAAHLEPEILLVDEVLAVGDAAFQKKCLGKMGEVAGEGRTVLFVSHNMAAVNRLCPLSLWLDRGQTSMTGSTVEVTLKYLTSNVDSTGRRAWPDGFSNPGINELKILSVSILGENGTITSTVDIRRSFRVEIGYHIRRPLPFCRIGFILKTGDGSPVFETYDSDNEEYGGNREPGIYKAVCEIPGNLLNSGRYVLGLNAGMPNIKNLAAIEGVLDITVQDTGAVGSYMHGLRRGAVRPSLKWTCERE